MPQILNSGTQPSASSLGQLPPLSRLLVALALRLAAWDARQRSRRALSRLNEVQLTDIGLDPRAAAHESAKPFWRS